jgi:hypothetical protein
MEADPDSLTSYASGSWRGMPASPRKAGPFHAEALGGGACSALRLVTAYTVLMLAFPDEEVLRGAAERVRITAWTALWSRAMRPGG